MRNKEELLFLGTGHATVTECYNTSFILRSSDDILLVDGGGGNGILRQMKQAEVSVSDLSGIFVTHAHTDHILGVVWVLRIIGEEVGQGTYSGNCKVCGGSLVLDSLKCLCRHTMSPAVWRNVEHAVGFVEADDAQGIRIGQNMEIRPFEVSCNPVVQFGFKAFLQSGKTVACLGDVPCPEHLFSRLMGMDWLLCEAFCLDRDKEIFKPYAIGHETVLDAARTARRLNVKNLVLYHTEDAMLHKRKKEYTEEAGKEFQGNVYVPDDLEKITLI